MSIAYKRILLKLSGEVLAGEKKTGIDNDTVVEGGIVGTYTGEKTDKICFFLLHKSTQMRKLGKF